jgi:hypothetical protein
MEQPTLTPSVGTRAGVSAAFARPLADVSAAQLAAMAAFVICLVVFRLTLSPGVSFGDSAEFERIPSELGIAHPTGFSAYVLLGKLASLVPLGSVAFRANMLSAAAASLAAAVAVLILCRLRVRPVVALAAALAGVLNGIVWPEATTAEVSAVHLAYMMLITHRLLVYRDGRRDRDLVLAGLLLGLAIANHPTALVLAPIVVAYGVWLAWRRIVDQPTVGLYAAVAIVGGMAAMLYVPIRAQFGPVDQYGHLTHLDDVIAWLTGAQFRISSGQLLTPGAAGTFLGELPATIGLLADRSNVLLLGLGVFGLLVGWFRERAFTLFALVLIAADVYLYAIYDPPLERYLLVGILFIAILAGQGLEWIAERLTKRWAAAAVAFLVLPLLIAGTHWAAADQSGDYGGRQFAALVFSQLPQNAVILTYWDAAQPMAYEHCVEGWRPDITILTPFDPDFERCDDQGNLDVLVRTRPVYALYEGPIEPGQLAARFRLDPVVTLQVPFGNRRAEFLQPLYRVTAPD